VRPLTVDALLGGGFLRSASWITSGQPSGDDSKSCWPVKVYPDVAEIFRLPSNPAHVI